MYLQLRTMTAALAISIAVTGDGNSAARAASANTGTQPTATTAPAAPPIRRARTPALLVLGETCPISRQGARYEFGFGPILLAGTTSLVNAVLPSLVNAGTGAVVNYLEERAAQLSASTTAFTSGTLFIRQTDAMGKIGSFEERYGCVVFIRGGFSAPRDRTPGGAWTDDAYSRVDNVLSPMGLALTTPPEVYAEFGISYERSRMRAPDGTPSNSYMFASIGVRPIYVDYQRVGTERGARNDKQLIFTVTISSRSPQATSGSNPTIINDVIDLGQVQAPRTLGAVELAGKSPRFARLPQPSEIQIKNLAGTVIGVVDDAIPVSVEVNLTETEQGSDVERAVAQGLRDNQSKIADAITQAAASQLKQ